MQVFINETSELFIKQTMQNKPHVLKFNKKNCTFSPAKDGAIFFNFFNILFLCMYGCLCDASSNTKGIGAYCRVKHFFNGESICSEYGAYLR